MISVELFHFDVLSVLRDGGRNRTNLTHSYILTQSCSECHAEPFHFFMNGQGYNCRHSRAPFEPSVFQRAVTPAVFLKFQVLERTCASISLAVSKCPISQAIVRSGKQDVLDVRCSRMLAARNRTNPTHLQITNQSFPFSGWTTIALSFGSRFIVSCKFSPHGEKAADISRYKHMYHTYTFISSGKLNIIIKPGVGCSVGHSVLE